MTQISPHKLPEHRPYITVITPTYNRAHTIGNAIKSMLDQTYQNWEMILVDDGSSDNTREVVLMFNDPRVNYFRVNNGGPSKARNFGLSQSSGIWVMYLDSDDTLLSQCVETMLEWAGKNPDAIFGFPRSTRVLELYENGVLVESIDDSQDTPETFTIQDIFERNAGFSPNGFMYVPIVLQKYTQRFGSDNLVSQTTYGDWADAFEYIYQKHQTDKTLERQTWYPSKAIKWRKRQADFEAGKLPPYHYHYFKKKKQHD